MPVDTLVIITGASRGLGQAMAAQYLAEGAFVLGLSRRPSAGLASAGSGGLEQWTADLADPLPVAQRLAAWLAEFERRAVGTPLRRVRLIHNAAMLSAPGDVAAADAGELAQSLRIGLEAPVALTAAFLRATAHGSAVDRRVLFVSSGLGRRAMAGSAAYCAQKAGLDHFARALALEEATRTHGARVAPWHRASSTLTCRGSCAAPTRIASRPRPPSPASTPAARSTARPRPRRR
jgi:NAD(P)-dependent dehydrogenase (short-subunit alcohol dehydrogenase family)